MTGQDDASSCLGQMVHFQIFDKISIKMLHANKFCCVLKSRFSQPVSTDSKIKASRVFTSLPG